MALIKKNEFKKMTEGQLKEKLVEIKKELMKINTQKSTGTSLENPGRVKEIRRTIARILILLNEKQKGAKTFKEGTEKI